MVAILQQPIRLLSCLLNSIIWTAWIHLLANSVSISCAAFLKQITLKRNFPNECTLPIILDSTSTDQGVYSDV